MNAVAAQFKVKSIPPPHKDSVAFAFVLILNATDDLHIRVHIDTSVKKLHPKFTFPFAFVIQNVIINLENILSLCVIFVTIVIREEDFISNGRDSLHSLHRLYEFSMWGGRASIVQLLCSQA